MKVHYAIRSAGVAFLMMLVTILVIGFFNWLAISPEGHFNEDVGSAGVTAGFLVYLTGLTLHLREQLQKWATLWRVGVFLLIAWVAFLIRFDFPWWVTALMFYFIAWGAVYQAVERRAVGRGSSQFVWGQKSS